MLTHTHTHTHTIAFLFGMGARPLFSCADPFYLYRIVLCVFHPTGLVFTTVATRETAPAGRAARDSQRPSAVESSSRRPVILHGVY